MPVSGPSYSYGTDWERTIPVSWAAATSDSKSLWGLTGVWLALSLTLLFGHITLWAESAAGAEHRVAGVEPFGSPSSSAVRRDPLPSSSDHRSTMYTGRRSSLVESRTLPRGNELTGQPVIVMELLAANLISATPIRVRTSDLALPWPYGRLDEVDRFEHIESPTGFTVDPGGAKRSPRCSSSLVVDPVLTDMALRAGESGRTPSVLPLLGPVLPPSFPVPGRVDDTRRC